MVLKKSEPALALWIVFSGQWIALEDVSYRAFGNGHFKLFCKDGGNAWGSVPLIGGLDGKDDLLNGIGNSGATSFSAGLAIGEQPPIAFNPNNPLGIFGEIRYSRCFCPESLEPCTFLAR